jgi:Domain of unknown function (DUF4253)
VSLSETELKEFLSLNNVDCRSLKLLWEIDSKRVYGLTVSRAEAIDRWHRLRQLINESKYYPVILGCEDEIEWHNEYIARSSVSINAIVDRASTLDAKKWFSNTAQQIYDCEYVEAEVVSITNNVIEMRVSRPPLNRYDALSLATEHYLYCNDIVEQGTKNLNILAAKLLKSSVWYFWWDLLK